MDTGLRGTILDFGKTEDPDVDVDDWMISVLLVLTWNSLEAVPLEFWLEKDLTLTTSSHKSSSSSVISSITCLANTSGPEEEECVEVSPSSDSLTLSKFLRERLRKSTELGLQCFNMIWFFCQNNRVNIWCFWWQHQFDFAKFGESQFLFKFTPLLRW